MEINHLSDQALADELKRRKEAKKGQKDAFKQLSNEIVPTILDRLQAWSEEGKKIKQEVYNNLRDLIDLKFAAFEVKSDQQSHTFSTSTGESITIGYNVTPGFDDTVHMGIAKVREFINSLVKDQDSAVLVKQITKLLKANAKGELDPKRVLELHQLAQDYNDIGLIEGVNIIQESYQPKRSNWFIKASVKNAQGIEEHVPLSMAAFPFEDGFDLSNLLKTNE